MDFKLSFYESLVSSCLVQIEFKIQGDFELHFFNLVYFAPLVPLQFKIRMDQNSHIRIVHPAQLLFK